MKPLHHVIYLLVALAMLAYAVPKLDLGQGAWIVTLFGIVWIGLALMVIAAHLHRLLGVDEETAKELTRVKKMRRLRQEQVLEQTATRLLSKKKSSSSSSR
ncbi:hypothetical protein [Paenibacillus sp. y28]|uniref:hypothetical protein n=1 Tax=Paenibacillus sp. y28 TaxID=3129110 RepID=UPI00301A7731